MARVSNKKRPRNEYRMDPDKFESPKKLGTRPASSGIRSVVDKVLGGVLTAGNSVVSLAAGLLAVSLVVYSGYVIYDSVKVETEPYFTAWDLLDYKPEYITNNETPLSANDLQDINEDYRGWLTVYDTSIDYPVLQGDDDLYYAWHDIYGNSSLTGAIYLSHGNSADLSDSYNLVYGHHMSNKAMFGALDYYLDANYYNAHRDGIIVTDSGAYDIRVFAVATTDAYESEIYTVGNRAEEVKAFLTQNRTDEAEEEVQEGDAGETTKMRTSVHVYDEDEAAKATKIIALSTCASAETNGRLVVFGRMEKRNLITVDAKGYEGIYDGQPHTVTGTETKVDGAKIEYSIDGGETWTEEAPSITDAGTLNVIVRATSPANGTATKEVTLTVHPKPVTVTAEDKTKVYGEEEPELTRKIEGVLPGDEDKIVISGPTCDNDGNVGKYPINVTGEKDQGNYEVTFVPGTFEIKKATGLTVNATGYTGTYDGAAHPVNATATLPDGTTPEGTVLYYSTDGGVTWTTIIPSITNPGTINVMIRAENPNYENANGTAVLQVNARPGGGGGGGTNPTPDNPTPDNPETISVTIRKEWRNDTEATRPATVRMVLTVGSSSQVVTLSASNGWTETVNGIPAGTSYAWSEPNVPGYRQTAQTGANNVTTVVNTWNGQQPDTGSHNLTIRYRYQDGTEAASPYRASIAQGSRYDIASPQIDGYVPTQARVSGTMPGRDLEVTVVYVPAENEDELTVIDDYGTPLGVNKVFIATGDCFE